MRAFKCQRKHTHYCNNRLRVTSHRTLCFLSAAGSYATSPNYSRNVIGKWVAPLEIESHSVISQVLSRGRDKWCACHAWRWIELIPASYVYGARRKSHENTLTQTNQHIKNFQVTKLLPFTIKFTQHLADGLSTFYVNLHTHDSQWRPNKLNTSTHLQQFHVGGKITLQQFLAD